MYFPAARTRPVNILLAMSVYCAGTNNKSVLLCLMHNTSITFYVNKNKSETMGPEQIRVQNTLR